MKRLGKRAEKRFAVYSVTKNGRKILHQSYADATQAREHLKKLRKLYGEFIQAGIDTPDGSKLSTAVAKCLKRLEEL